jgi:hypothetical protein
MTGEAPGDAVATTGTAGSALLHAARSTVHSPARSVPAAPSRDAHRVAWPRCDRALVERCRRRAGHSFEEIGEFIDVLFLGGEDAFVHGAVHGGVSGKGLGKVAGGFDG